MVGILDVFQFPLGSQEINECITILKEVQDIGALDQGITYLVYHGIIRNFALNDASQFGSKFEILKLENIDYGPKYSNLNWANNNLTSSTVVSNLQSYSKHHSIIAIQIQEELISLLNSDLSKNRVIMKDLMIVGSSFTNLSVASDVDLVLFVANANADDVDDLFVLECAAKSIKSHGFEIFEIVKGARVPVLKALHNKTGKKVDIGVNNANAIRNSRLLLRYTELDNRIQPLMLLIKYWAKQRGVCDTKNSTISSYAWIILCIYFLQSIHILPILQPLDSDCLGFTSEKLDLEPSDDTLSDLFFKFFMFYGSSPDVGFDIINCIVSIRFQLPVMKRIEKAVEKMTESQQATVDSNEIHHAFRQPPPWWRFSIEDPFELNHDLGSVIQQPMGQIHILNELRRACVILLSHRSGESGSTFDTCFDEICQLNDAVPVMSVVCHKCNMPGHTSKICPEICCYACGGKGHYAINCPNKMSSNWYGNHRANLCPKKLCEHEGVLSTPTDDRLTAAPSAPTPTLGKYSSQTFFDAVLKWNVFSFSNPNLLDDQLVRVPSVFHSSSDFFEGFYPYVLEEVREEIHSLALKEFNGVRCYRTAVKPLHKSTDIDITSNGRVRVMLHIEAGEYLSHLQCLLPSFGLYVKNGPTNITLRHLKNLSHLLVSIGYKEGESESDKSNVVSFNADLPSTSEALNLIRDVGQGWLLHVLEVGTISPSRVCDALGRGGRRPEFMDDILSGSITSDFSVKDRPLGDYEKAEPLVRALNPSQRDVVARVLDAGRENVPLIQLVKGPPGTGKTSTLVAIIRSILMNDLRVHATAPTNVAVGELARRCLAHTSSTPPLSVRDMLLIGTKERLKISDDSDPLDQILYDSRLERMKFVFTNFKSFVSTFFSLIRRKEASVTESETTCEQMSEFKTVVEALQSMLRTVFYEIPVRFFKNLTLSTYESLQSTFETLIGLSDIDLLSWMSNSAASQTDRIVLEEIEVLLRNIVIEKKPSRLDAVILKEPNLVFSTVNVAGRDMFMNINFDVTIVDEATQLVQAGTAIILKPSLRCLVLAGDDKQLPATVMSQKALELGYGESLFGRLINLGYPHSLLNTQYRMHADISRWPRIQFYEGKLIDGLNVESTGYCHDWHSTFPPLCVYNVDFGREESHMFGSKYNETEAQVIRQITCILRKEIPINLTLGIISPYKEQVSLLSHLADSGKANGGRAISVNTVDGFQGQECDVIIFSAVRSNDEKKIGFLKDERRLNVAITRARYCVIIVCNIRTVTSDGTWGSLIKHAEVHSRIYNQSNCDIIKRAAKKWNSSEERLADYLSPQSSLMSELKWEVIFTNEFKASLLKFETKIRKRVIQAVISLGSGKWPKFESENPLVSDLYKRMLHVHRVLSLQLVWSVDVCKIKYKQRLVMWEVVPLDCLAKSIRRVENTFKVYSSEYIDLCGQKSDKYPLTFNEIEWFRVAAVKDTTDSSNSLEMDLERSHVSTSATLMKFFDFDAKVAQLLVALKDGETIELPFVMSREEESIVRHQGSVFVLGRSGTGKTTTILHRMFLESKCVEREADDEANTVVCNQLLVTASPILCEAIRRSYWNMQKTYSKKRVQEGEERDYNEDAEPLITLASVPQDQFPLIITYSMFLSLLDNTLAVPFFLSRSKRRATARQNEDGESDSGCSDEDEDDDGSSNLGMVSEIPNSGTTLTEVTFERFCSHYYPRLSDKLECEASVVFTEIMSHIKGSLGALHTDSGCLSLQDYIALSNSRQSSLCTAQRQLVYEAFLKYEKLKRQEYRQYDQLDRVHYLYSSLCKYGYKGVWMDSVFVDEVQDLTPAQIALFKFVSKDFSRYVFAGDTAQTIAHGVGFRFETVKDIFYSEYLNGSCIDEKTVTKLMPEIWHLTQNFRTHAGVVNIANSVVELILKFFPLSIDRLKPESSRVFGPLSIFLSRADNFLFNMFTSGDMLSCEFGAEQVILVRDEDCKRSVLGITENRALVLTVLEAKGMEFTDCLVYNFFHSSPLKNGWRIIYNAMESSESRPAFSRDKHGLLCVELKLLYVLLTRARQNLILFDEDNAAAQPMLRFWEQRSLVETKEFDDDIRSVFQSSSSSPQEWEQRGEQLFERRQYGNARLCYQRAGNESLERVCIGFEYELESERCALKNAAESNQWLCKAVEVFVSIRQLGHAARCCEKLNKWARAADFYLELKKYLEAALCFEKIRKWTDAALAYEKVQKFDEALRCYYKAHEYDMAIAFLSGIRDSGAMSEEEAKSRVEVCAKKGALYAHNIGDMTKTMDFVKLFPTTKDKRLFLKRRGHFEQLLQVEVSDNCFDEAGKIHEGLFDFINASDCYERAGMVAESCRCALKAVRCAYLDENFLYLPAVSLGTQEKDSLLRISSKLSHIKNNSTALTGLKIEADFLLQILVPDVASQQHLDLKSVYDRCREVGISLWRLRVTILRIELNRSLESEEQYARSVSFIGQLDSVVSGVFGALEILAEHGSLQLMSSVDKEKVTSVLALFELSPDGPLATAKYALGPGTVTGLGRVFHIKLPDSTDITGPNRKVNSVKISLKEFAQLTIGFLTSVMAAYVNDCIASIARFINKLPKDSLADQIGRFTLPVNKRETIVTDTSARFQALVHWMKLQESVWLIRLGEGHMAEKARKVAMDQALSDIKHILLPSLADAEDMRGVEVARKSADSIGHIASIWKAPGLNYDRIGEMFLLGELSPDRMRISEKLLENIRAELVRLTHVANDNDGRWLLCKALQWESCDYVIEPTPGWTAGSLLFSINMAVPALIDDAYQGGLTLIFKRQVRPVGRYTEKAAPGDVFTYERVLQACGGGYNVFDSGSLLDECLRAALCFSVICLRQTPDTTKLAADFPLFGQTTVRGGDVFFIFRGPDSEKDVWVPAYADELSTFRVEDLSAVSIVHRQSSADKNARPPPPYTRQGVQSDHFDCFAILYYWAISAKLQPKQPFLSHQGSQLLSASVLRNAFCKLAAYWVRSEQVSYVLRESRTYSKLSAFILIATGNHKGVSPKHGCYSPTTYTRLLEKYFVLLMLHARQFLDVILPLDLATDVLARRNKAYADAIRRYRNGSMGTRPYQLTKLIVHCMKLLEDISYAQFKSWQDGYEGFSHITPPPECENLFCSFIMRVCNIVIIALVNKPDDIIAERLYAFVERHSKNEVTNEVSILMSYYSKFLKEFATLSISKDRALRNFPPFCKKLGNTELVRLCCRQGMASGPNDLTRMVLDVTDDDVISIVPSTAPSGQAAAGVPEEVHEEAPSSSEKKDGDDSVTASMLQAAVLLPISLSAEDRMESLVRPFYVTLLLRLEEARSRLKLLTPLEKQQRLAEKELMAVGLCRTSDTVYSYVNCLCPLMLELQDWNDKIDSYLQSHLKANQKATEDLDIIADHVIEVQACITDVVPDRHIFSDELGEHILRLQNRAENVLETLRSSSLLRRIFKEVEEATRVSSVKVGNLHTNKGNNNNNNNNSNNNNRNSKNRGKSGKQKR